MSSEVLCVTSPLRLWRSLTLRSYPEAAGPLAMEMESREQGMEL